MTQTIPEKTQNQDPEVQRRFWFDYLSKLNDRQRQASQSTGITNWVLIVAAIGLAYGLISQVEQLNKFPKALEIASLIFVLQYDLVFFFGIAFLSLYLFSLGTLPQIRLCPDLERRREIVLFWSYTSLLIVITATHFCFSWILAGPQFVKWYLLVSGVFLLINASLLFTKRVRRGIREKKSGIPLPRFTGYSWGPEWTPIAMAIFFPFGCYAGAALLIQLRTASQSSMGWLLPLQAASQLTLLLATMCFLGERFLQSASREIYLQLERDIVLDDLSTEEIKRRFILQSLGPSISDWINGLAQELKEVSQKVQRMQESALCRIPEIEALDEAYAHERVGRAIEVKNNLRTTHLELFRKIKSIEIRLDQLFEHPCSLDEELLRSAGAELLAQLKHTLEEFQSTVPLLGRLDHLLDAIATDSPSPKGPQQTP